MASASRETFDRPSLPQRNSGTAQHPLFTPDPGPGKFNAMMLKVLSQIICAAAMMLIAAAPPSAAWAHGSHEHAATVETLDKGMPNQAVAGPAEAKGAALSPAFSTLDTLCSGLCCGAGCCGSCMMVLAQDVSQVPPLTLAATRIAVPDAFGGPGTIPEALPRPPKSFA